MSIASWSWVVFILSLGARYLNFNNKVLAYGNEAVLPLKKIFSWGYQLLFVRRSYTPLQKYAG